MSSTVHCPGCNQNIGGYSMQQMQDLQACPKCGLTAEEAAMKMQDELAGMFNRNMNMSEYQERVQTPVESVGHQQDTPTPSALGYNSSQHYYPPPAHLASKIVVEDTRDDDTEVKQILQDNSIDWSHLLTSQINLFKQAAPDQRNRLIELWRISPPETARTDGLGGWKETTVEQEEELARIRHSRTATHNESTQPSGNFVVISQDADMDSAIGDLDHPYAVEPYMKSGYEILAERDYNSATIQPEKAYKQAVDPAFSGREWWRDFVSHQSMENQYGAFEHMAQFHASEIQVAHEDEEML